MAKKQELRPCLFLDRDGVINVDKGYLYRPEEIELMPGIIDLIQWAKNKQFLVIVLTNQSGIARGLYTEEDYQKFTVVLSNILKSHKAPVDAWYHCPYHPQGTLEGYGQLSELRKPRPGLYYQALKEWPIDKEKSFMVGDKESDVLEEINLKTYLIRGQYEIKKHSLVFNDLHELLDYLKENDEN